MARYGLRASSNFSDLANRAACFTNLGLNAADFMAIARISASGVSAFDFLSLKGLKAPLELQITGAASLVAQASLVVRNKVWRNGGIVSGSIIVSGLVSTDRPLVSTSGTGAIYNSASGSFFAPTSGNTFSGGGSYLSGPMRVAGSGLTIASGLGNYQGVTYAYDSHYEPYKAYQRISASGMVFDLPTKLPSPLAFSGCTLWLDAEKSPTTLFATNRISEWTTLVGGGPSARQTVSGSSPYYLASGIVDSGTTKPGISLLGNEFFNLGSIGGAFADAATLIVMAQVESSDYCIMSNSTSNSGRWRTASGNGNWPLFVASPIERFPSFMPANGTSVFSVRASQAYGLELRNNGLQFDYLSPLSFTYQSSGSYLLGSAPAGAGRFAGKLFAVIGYNRVLSDQELRTIEEYCLWRYNSVYDPKKAQVVQLEDGSTFELEDNSPLEAGL